MRKILISLSILFVLSSSMLAQPISLNVLTNDTTICTGTSALLTAEFDTTLYETSSYAVVQGNHNPMPTIGTSVTANLIDDTYWGPFPIGFTYCFYEEEYTQFWVGANGWISFIPLSSATYDPYVTQALPNPDPSRPRAAVLGPYRDWHPGIAGDIKYATVGGPGNKRLIVSWIDVALFSCTTIHGTFQIVLRQSSNIAENHLISVPTCLTWQSGNGVQGIQDELGVDFCVVPGRNNTNFQASAESWRFKPNGPPQPNTVEWWANGALVGVGNDLLVSPSTTTEYVAMVSPCGSFFSDTVVVTPQPCGFLSGSHTNAICNGEASGTATIVLHEGIPPFDFTWGFPDTSNIISNTIGTSDSTNTITNLAAGEYGVSVSMLGGLLILDTTITIDEPQAVLLSVFSSPETCPNAEDGTISCNVTNGIPPFTFSCQGQANSLPTNLSSYTFENLPKGNYNLTVTDANGCQGTATVEVLELFLEYTTSQSEIQCYGDTNALAYVNVTGGVTPYTFSWSPLGGNTPGLTNLGAGTYYVTVTDHNGCKINTSLTFNEPPPVNIYTSADKTICYGQEANITSAAIGGTAPYNFHWTPGGYISQNITVDPVESTEYCVYVTDSFNCKSTTKCMTVFVDPPLEIKAFSNIDTICQGDTTTIFAELEGGNGGPYIFELFDGPVVTPPFKVSPNITTKYIVVGSDNCNTPIVKDTVLITVLPAPLVNITSNVIKGCQPLRVEFSENSPDIGQSYYWDFGDSEAYNYSTSKAPVHTFYNPGIYEVGLTIVSPWNCVTKAQHHDDIIVYQKPISLFYADPIQATIVDPVISFQNQSIDLHTAYWAFGDGDSVIINNPYPHSFPPVPGEYTVSLIAESTNNCRDTSYQVITIEDQGRFYAPSAFNPYSINPENTVFKPVISLLDRDSYQLYIYNRWGELIFESNDIEQGWDGRANDKIHPMGSYTWLIIFRDIEGKNYQKTGSVTIVQ